MADRGVTMLDMAKSNRKPSKPQGRSPSYVVYARVPVALGRVFDAYLEQTRPKTDKAAVVELALERFFQSEGFLTKEGPPPAEE